MADRRVQHNNRGSGGRYSRGQTRQRGYRGRTRGWDGDYNLDRPPARPRENWHHNPHRSGSGEREDWHRGRSPTKRDSDSDRAGNKYRSMFSESSSEASVDRTAHKTYRLEPREERDRERGTRGKENWEEGNTSATLKWGTGEWSNNRRNETPHSSNRDKSPNDWIQPPKRRRLVSEGGQRPFDDPISPVRGRDTATATDRAVETVTGLLKAAQHGATVEEFTRGETYPPGYQNLIENMTQKFLPSHASSHTHQSLRLAAHQWIASCYATLDSHYNEAIAKGTVTIQAIHCPDWERAFLVARRQLEADLGKEIPDIVADRIRLLLPDVDTDSIQSLEPPVSPLPKTRRRSKSMSEGFSGRRDSGLGDSGQALTKREGSHIFSPTSAHVSGPVATQPGTTSSTYTEPPLIVRHTLSNPPLIIPHPITEPTTTYRAGRPPILPLTNKANTTTQDPAMVIPVSIPSTSAPTGPTNPTAHCLPPQTGTSLPTGELDSILPQAQSSLSQDLFPELTLHNSFSSAGSDPEHINLPVTPPDIDLGTCGGSAPFFSPDPPLEIFAEEGPSSEPLEPQIILPTATREPEVPTVVVPPPAKRKEKTRAPTRDDRDPSPPSNLTIHESKDKTTWSVSPRKPCIIMGDSNLKCLPKIHNSQVQLDIYPGCRIPHMSALIKRLVTPSTTTTQVLISVGLGDVKAGSPATLQQAVKHLHSTAQSKFPKATIRMAPIQFGPYMSPTEQKRLDAINQAISSLPNPVPILPFNEFKSEDHVHWDRSTGLAHLRIWGNCLDLAL